MIKRVTTCLIQILLFCVSMMAQNEVTHQWQYRYHVDRINGIYIPKDIDEAIDTLDTILSAEDKQFATDSLSLEAFGVGTHLGLGMWIRNNFWNGGVKRN